MTNSSDTYIIKTGLNDVSSLEVLKSTMGQLSDGIWENSRTAEQFWPFANVEMIDNEVCLVIDKKLVDRPYGWRRCYTNGFYWKFNFDKNAIKDYFAKKVRAVVRENAKDYPERGIRCTANCDVILDYMGGHGVHEVRASDAYKVYKALRMR